MKKFLLTLSVFFLAVHSLLAQVPPPPDYHENSGPGGQPSSLPVDQYVFILIGIALTIGMYIMWNKRKAFN